MATALSTRLRSAFVHYFSNVACPREDRAGRMMLRGMNLGHRKLAEWGRSFVSFAPDAVGLDIGCGGGANLAVHAQLTAHAIGLDASPQSVATSRELNAEAIAQGRVDVYEGSASDLPLESESCDYVTAYETVYFWPDVVNCFREVHRVLRPGGWFLIVNEMRTPADGEFWASRLGFTVYPPEEMVAMLRAAGFSAGEVHSHPNHRWVCYIGYRR